MRHTKTILLWLDALAANQVTKANTPTLFSLKRRSNWSTGVHVPVAGYSSIPASVLTGTLPNQHQQFAVYSRASQPDRLLGLANIAGNRFQKNIYNLIRYFVLNEEFFVPPLHAKWLHSMVPQQRFNYTQPEALPVPTIFDNLRNQGRSFLFANWPLVARYQPETGYRSHLSLSDKSDRAKLDSFWHHYASVHPDFAFIHLWDLDEVGHAFGPMSHQSRQALQVYDQALRQTLQQVDAQTRVVVFSDHGMTPVKEWLDPAVLVEQLAPKAQWFADSTLLRLWFTRRDKSKALTQLTARFTQKFASNGHLLSKTDLKKLHLDKLTSAHFDVVVVLKPGYAFWPSSFYGQNKPLGMHGYLSADVTDQHLPFLAVNVPGQPHRVQTERIFEWL